MAANRYGFARSSLTDFVLSGIAVRRIAKSGGATPVPIKVKKPKPPRIAGAFRMPSQRTKQGRRQRARMAAAGMQRYRARLEA